MQERIPCVCGDGEFVPIEALLVSLPWPERDHGAHDNVVPGAHTPLDELPPWVPEELLWDASDWNSVFTRDRKGHRKHDDDESDEESNTDHPLPELDEVEFLNELVAMRKEVASKAVNLSNFRVIEYRGRFTKLAHGVAFDSFRSEAMPGPPSEFCVRFNL